MRCATKTSIALAVGPVVAAVVVAVTPVAASSAPAKKAAKVDLATASSYLATTTGANGVSGGTSLAQAGYYESFADFADFGLTIDGALALEASGKQGAALAKAVDFLADADADGSGRTVNDWTGIGTKYAAGGSIGKEAVLAESAGRDPRSFAGHNLITALDGLVCTKANSKKGCAGKGNYAYAQSTFSQALGVIGQLRAGDTANAAAPVDYLESLQHRDGAFPSTIPDSGDDDVDSTGMAAMALALLPKDAAASAAVTKAEAWIAQQQESDGGFPGSAGESTNSAALAIQCMALAGKKAYAKQIAAAQAFLAREQNADGGENVASTGQQGSDVRPTTQVVNGVVTTSYGTLKRKVKA